MNLFSLGFDDTRKIATLDLSMMGRPDNLVLSKLDGQHYCSDTGHHTSLRNRQN